MDRDVAYKLFEPYTSKMNHEEIEVFKKAFHKLPNYWFTKPASSSGKYHPEFSNLGGGLVYHTLYALQVWEQIWKAYDKDLSVKNITFESGVFALTFHDALKYGVNTGDDPKWTIKDHDRVSAMWMKEIFDNHISSNSNSEGAYLGMLDGEWISIIIESMKTHMGPWSTDGKPKSFFGDLVFICDYVASMKCYELVNQKAKEIILGKSQECVANKEKEGE